MASADLHSSSWFPEEVHEAESLVDARHRVREVTEWCRYWWRHGKGVATVSGIKEKVPSGGKVKAAHSPFPLFLDGIIIKEPLILRNTPLYYS